MNLDSSVFAEHGHGCALYLFRFRVHQFPNTLFSLFYCSMQPNILPLYGLIHFTFPIRPTIVPYKRVLWPSTPCDPNSLSDQTLEIGS